MNIPIRAGDPIDTETFAEVRLRTIFECRKWDPQVGDVDVLCPFPVLIDEAEWDILAGASEKLAAEAVAAEGQLLQNPKLVRELGLPRAVTRCLRRGQPPLAENTHPRFMRFDFHWTTRGWMISECNADVPGGWNEASGFSALVAEQCKNTRLTGDPTDALTRTILRRTGPGGRVAMLHATAYVDDRQVMQHLADRMLTAGLEPLMLSPDHVDWSTGQAHWQGPIDLMLRFFPAEWLINLRPKNAWTPYFLGHNTPSSNPATALLIQSKRLPIVWDRLTTPTDTWRRYLPETRDPRHADWRNNRQWILKPALGRVGENIAMQGITTQKDMRRITRAARLRPSKWIAQQRFESIPIDTPQGPMHACVGVYVVDGQAVGSYTRLAPGALIDLHAVDTALLIQQPVNQPTEQRQTQPAGTIHA